MRKLASIQRVNRIAPHTNADALELAYIGEWQVVAQKGLYRPGQLVIYFEIDSVLPEIPQFEFLRKSSFIDRPWAKGFRLKAIKLRGERSFGLLAPLEEFPGLVAKLQSENALREDTDVTEDLGVFKYEAPIPAQLAGYTKGNFPGFLRKSDQERLENLYRKILPDVYWHEFEESLKLDGSSCTIYLREGELGVCSRNLDLKMSDENADNTFVKMARKYEEALRAMSAHYNGLDIAVQGEVMGPGIQGNREGLADHEFYTYNIFDITHQKWVGGDARRLMCSVFGIPHVPVLAVRQSFIIHRNFESFKKASDCASIRHPVAEGKVYKSEVDPNISFKVISNMFYDSGGE